MMTSHEGTGTMPKTLDEIIAKLAKLNHHNTESGQRAQWESNEEKLFPNYHTADAFIVWAVTKLSDEAAAMEIIEDPDILPQLASILLAEAFPDMLLEFKALHRLGIINDFER